MIKPFHQELFPLVRGASLQVLAIIFSLASLCPSTPAADTEERATIERSQPGDPGSPHASAVRNGVLETKDGLTLKLTTDLGSVNIVPLEAGAAPLVRYTVHIETDARGTAAQQLLENYSLKAKSTYAGVEIIGVLPPQAARSADAQFWVQFEVGTHRRLGASRRFAGALGGETRYAGRTHSGSGCRG